MAIYFICCACLHVRRQKLNTVRVLRRASACLSEARKAFYVRRAWIGPRNVPPSTLPVVPTAQ
ncbi:hypothetical protein V8C40DRAFT_263146 [Trichoderma camerunense]